jgi:hypothetical protein
MKVFDKLLVKETVHEYDHEYSNLDRYSRIRVSFVDGFLWF